MKVRGCETEAGFPGSAKFQKGDRNCVILGPIWPNMYNRPKATPNPSLNKLKFVTLENTCSLHVCYCGNNKKWLKLRHLAEKNPRFISMEKWERKCETRNIITGSYVSAPREVMALSPAPSPMYTVCIEHRQRTNKSLPGGENPGFMSHIWVCEHKPMLKLVVSPWTFPASMEGLVLQHPAPPCIAHRVTCRIQSSNGKFSLPRTR